MKLNLSYYLFLTWTIGICCDGFQICSPSQSKVVLSSHQSPCPLDESGTILHSTISFNESMNNSQAPERKITDISFGRRHMLSTALLFTNVFISSTVFPKSSLAEELTSVVEVIPTGDVKKLFNEGRALEQQGNIPAAMRLYNKVTKISPKFIYGWSNLGNTQVALGSLQSADESYSTAINLCVESLKEEEKFGTPRCNDLYLLYLNRGSVRLNNRMEKEALSDLENSNKLRNRPDAIILQNLARAKELNGNYAAADEDYSIAISMTSNEVVPFWLRSALVKFQLGDTLGAFDLTRRVENRFPEAPEVRAALATLLKAKGDDVGARRKFLEIPDRQRLKYADETYVKTVVAWPPKMMSYLSELVKEVGDDTRSLS